jgi:hypothetical protein
MKFTKLAVPVMALALVASLTGCGKKPGDGIATAGQNGAKSSSAPVATDPQERMRQFTQCMRDNGIDMKDAEVSGDGGFSVQIGPGEGAAPADQGPNKEDMEKMQKAMEACKQYAPGGGDLGKPDPAMQEKMREFAKCMRENGVENFPDPQENGGIMIQGGGPGSNDGLNPDDPTFKAAQEKCKSLLPDGGAGAKTEAHTG